MSLDYPHAETCPCVQCAMPVRCCTPERPCKGHELDALRSEVQRLEADLDHHGHLARNFAAVERQRDEARAEADALRARLARVEAECERAQDDARNDALWPPHGNHARSTLDEFAAAIRAALKGE